MQTTVINLLSREEYQAALDRPTADIDHAWFVQQLDDVPTMKKFVMIRPREHPDFWIIAEVEVPETKNLKFDRQKNERPKLGLRFKTKTAYAFKHNFDTVLSSILTNTYIKLNPTAYPL